MFWFGFLLEGRTDENIAEQLPGENIAKQVPDANNGEDRPANQGIYGFVLLNNS